MPQVTEDIHPSAGSNDLFQDSERVIAERLAVSVTLGIPHLSSVWRSRNGILLLIKNTLSWAGSPEQPCTRLLAFRLFPLILLGRFKD